MARWSFSLDAPLKAAATLLFPLPIDTPEQRVADFRVEGAQSHGPLQAQNSGQQALRLTAEAGTMPKVVVDFAPEPQAFAPWVFAPTGGAHETPSPELVDLMGRVAPAGLTTVERVWRIVRHVESRFTYGRREVGLGDDTTAIPALECDLHRGTCIDTHTYSVAALRAAGLEAAYVSGVFLPEGDSSGHTGHCWFVVRAEGVPHHWDISHFLEYGLGPVQPVLNPKPGVRQALSVGRDLEFVGPDGPVTLPRLSGFNRLDGRERVERLDTIAAILSA
jgi:transglutaminase-like putative cysteine protease